MALGVAVTRTTALTIPKRDNVICLKHPINYTSDKGALFEVHFEKARHLYGEDINPFEAQLIADGFGKQYWQVKLLEQSTYEKVVSLANEGLNQKEIAEEFDHIIADQTAKSSQQTLNNVKAQFQHLICGGNISNKSEYCQTNPNS